MAKVTKNLQIALPKTLTQRYGIRPGDEIQFEDAGEAIRMVLMRARAGAPALDVGARLRLFDAATDRQRVRQSVRRQRAGTPRDWTREELYRRGCSNAD